jgi:DNA-directed RNA polymerase subunit RPC12/RpoP
MQKINTKYFHYVVSQSIRWNGSSIIIDRPNLEKLDLIDLSLFNNTDEILYFLNIKQIKNVFEKLKLTFPNGEVKLQPSLVVVNKLSYDSTIYNMYIADHINLITSTGECFCSAKSFPRKPNYKKTSIDVFRDFNYRIMRWSQKRLIKIEPILKTDISSLTNLYLINNIKSIRSLLLLTPNTKNNAPKHRQHLKDIKSNFELTGAFISNTSPTKYQCRNCSNIISATPNDVLGGLKCSKCGSANNSNIMV